MSSEEAEVVTHVLRTSSDYYAMLKVGRTATTTEIKSSYKRMALRLHPDKNKHARAEECFKLLGKAHTTLADDQKRSVYDRGGEEAVQRQDNGGSSGGANPFAGQGFAFRPGGATFHFGGGHGGGEDFVEDLFGMFFGGMDPRMHQQRRQQQQRQYQQQQQARAQYQQQQQQQQYQRQRQQGGGGSEGLSGILGFLPLVLFFVFAMILQSSAFDSTPQTATSRGGHNTNGANGNMNGHNHNPWSRGGASSGSDTRNRLFTLVADEYHPHERVTTQLDEEWVFDNSIDGGQSHRERGATGGLRVPYFVNAGAFDRNTRQRGVSVRTVEEEVAKAKKESLERRCQADQMVAKAARKKKVKSAACDDLEDFAPLRL